MKTDETIKAENQIFVATAEAGTFGCFEVTIGWWGTERVDFLTYSTKGEWRCYEIKTSVSDFHSKCKNTFIGHFNYYVLTQEVYDKVKDEIPREIGVYVGGQSVKHAKRVDLKVDKTVLYESMIRSLAREQDKFRACDNKERNERINRERAQYQRSYEQSQHEKWELQDALYKVYGDEGYDKVNAFIKQKREEHKQWRKEAFN